MASSCTTCPTRSISMYTNSAFEILVYLMFFICSSDLIVVDWKWCKDVVIYSSSGRFHSDCEQAKTLQTLDYLAEGARWDLLIHFIQEGNLLGARIIGGCAEPIQLVQHVIAAILNFVQRGLFTLCDNLFHVNRHDNEDFIFAKTLQ